MAFEMQGSPQEDGRCREHTHERVDSDIEQLALEKHVQKRSIVYSGCKRSTYKVCSCFLLTCTFLKRHRREEKLA